MPNLHRLHVVNFTETVNERESVGNKKAKGIIGKVLTYEANADATKDGQKAKANLPKSTTVNKVKKNNNFCLPAKKISFRSKSELFRVRHYNEVLRRRHSSKRTWSFADVKNKVRSAIKQKKISQRNESKRNTKQQSAANRHAIKSQDDIKVLYSYERRKNKNNKRDLSPQVDRGIFKRSSSEIFGAGNRFRKNTYLYHETCRGTGLFLTPKRRKRRTESKPCILREALPLDMGSCQAQKCRFQRDDFPEHYNLVGFPFSSNPNNLIDPQQGAYYPRRPVIVLDCKGDVDRKCVNTQCVESAKDPANDKYFLSIKKNPPCAKNYYMNGFSKECNFKKKDKAVNRFFRIFKSILKYILVSLTIVAWLPCIIIVGACWLLVSPLRSKNICNKNSILNKEYSCCVPIKCEQGNVFSSMMKRVACKCQLFADTVQEVMNNTNYVKTPRQRCQQLHTAKMPSSVAAMHRKSSKWKPNPDKKYVLYYDDPRGWLMKPIRKQEYQDSNQNHIVQNINWFGQKSDKTVTFRDSVTHSPKKVSDRSHNFACPVLSPEVKSKADEGTPASNYKLSTESAQCGGCVHNRASEVKKYVSRNLAARPCPSLIKLLAPIPVRKKPQPKRIQRKKLIIKQQPLRRQRCQEQIPRRKRNHQPRTRHVCRPCKQENCYQRLHEDQTPVKKKVCKCCKSCAVSLKETVNDAEQTWDSECGDNCGSMFLCTLRDRPCFWVYRCCPSMYPDFLFFYKSCANCCYIGMFVLAACIWCPIFLCCYLCYHLVICCLCDS